MRLRGGDYLFAACTRMNNDLQRPCQDVIKMWVTDRQVFPYIMSEEMFNIGNWKCSDAVDDKTQLPNARDHGMGDRSERTDVKSIADDNE